MHETVIAKNIIQDAEEFAKKNNSSIEEIHLQIGELAHVPPKELVETLQNMIKWKITYDEIPAQAKCLCGFTGHPTILEHGHDFYLIECPQCKQVPPLTQGTEIKLLKIKIK